MWPNLLKFSDQCVFFNVRNVLYFYFGNICSKLKLPANSSAFFSDFKNLLFNVAFEKELSQKRKLEEKFLQFAILNRKMVLFC